MKSSISRDNNFGALGGLCERVSILAAFLDQLGHRSDFMVSEPLTTNEKLTAVLQVLGWTIAPSLFKVAVRTSRPVTMTDVYWRSTEGQPGHTDFFYHTEEHALKAIERWNEQ